MCPHNEPPWCPLWRSYDIVGQLDLNQAKERGSTGSSPCFQWCRTKGPRHDAVHLSPLETGFRSVCWPIALLPKCCPEMNSVVLLYAYFWRPLRRWALIGSNRVLWANPSAVMWSCLLVRTRIAETLGVIVAPQGWMPDIYHTGQHLEVSHSINSCRIRWLLTLKDWGEKDLIMFCKPLKSSN